MTMQFPVALLPGKGGGFTVTFPDVPEAISEGDTEAEALTHARDALVSALDFYFEDRRPVPSPSRPKRGQKVVELPASLAAKVLLLNELVRQDIRPAELARRLGTTPQEVSRLTDVHHTTRVDGIAAALRALGKRLDLRVI
jgi:antitoxin HicB